MSLRPLCAYPWGGLLLSCLPSPIVDDALCVSEPAVASASAARRMASTTTEPSRRVTESFPNWSPECGACIQSQCGRFVERCAGDAGCVSFAACRWKDNAPSPGSELSCEREFGQSSQEPLSAIRELGNCWQTSCVDACQLGTHWECAGKYSLPAPEGSPVRLTQVLQELTSDAPVVDATVRFCDLTTPPADCETTPGAQAVTDETGTATVEVPIATDHRVGWSGYRHVAQPDAYDVRLQTNLSMTLDHSMLQHVPTKSQTTIVSLLYGADLERGNVVFQVFDCARTGGEGVDLEIAAEVAGTEISDSRTMIRYQRGNPQNPALETGGTKAEGDGGGAIMNVTPGEWIGIRAVHRCTRDVVASTRILTSPGELLLLELHPDPEGG